MPVLAPVIMTVFSSSLASDDHWPQKHFLNKNKIGKFKKSNKNSHISIHNEILFAAELNSVTNDTAFDGLLKFTDVNHTE